MSLLCFAARTSIDDETEEAGCHEEPFYKDGEPLGHEHIVIPLEVDDQDKERQAVHEVILDAGRDIHARSFIGFCQESFPAPAIFFVQKRTKQGFLVEAGYLIR